MISAWPTLLWANAFPYHEGAWPHSVAAIERTVTALTDDGRTTPIELHAACVFGFERPTR